MNWIINYDYCLSASMCVTKWANDIQLYLIHIRMIKKPSVFCIALVIYHHQQFVVVSICISFVVLSLRCRFEVSVVAVDLLDGINFWYLWS